MEISSLIRNRRIELGLTLEEVSKAVGVGKSTVKKWEDGYISNMKRDKIASLAKVLKLNPMSLISGDMIPSTPTPQAPTPPPDDDITLLQSLDNIDRAEIRGTMKQMLKADKYQEDTPVSEAI